VTSDNHCTAVRTQVLERVGDKRSITGIDVPKWLVGEQAVGPSRDGRGDLDPPPLTGGQIPAPSVEEPHKVTYPRRGLNVSKPELSLYRAEVFADGAIRRQEVAVREIVESLTRKVVPPRTQVGSIPERDYAVVCLKRACRNVEQGRLAAPVTTNQKSDLSAVGTQRRCGEN